MTTITFTKKLNDQGNTIIIVKGKGMPEDFLGFGFDLKFQGEVSSKFKRVVLAEELEFMGSVKPILINRDLIGVDNRLVVGMTYKASDKVRTSDGVIMFIEFDGELKQGFGVLNTVFSRYDGKRINVKEVKWVVDKVVGKLTKAENAYLEEISGGSGTSGLLAKSSAKLNTALGGNFEEFAGVEQEMPMVNLFGMDLRLDWIGLGVVGLVLIGLGIYYGWKSFMEKKSGDKILGGNLRRVDGVVSEDLVTSKVSNPVVSGVSEEGRNLRESV